MTLDSDFRCTRSIVGLHSTSYGLLCYALRFCLLVAAILTLKIREFLGNQFKNRLKFTKIMYLTALMFPSHVRVSNLTWDVVYRMVS